MSDARTRELSFALALTRGRHLPSPSAFRTAKSVGNPWKKCYICRPKREASLQATSPWCYRYLELIGARPRRPWFLDRRRNTAQVGGLDANCGWRPRVVPRPGGRRQLGLPAVSTGFVSSFCCRLKPVFLPTHGEAKSHPRCCTRGGRVLNGLVATDPLCPSLPGDLPAVQDAWRYIGLLDMSFLSEIVSERTTVDAQ